MFPLTLDREMVAIWYQGVRWAIGKQTRGLGSRDKGKGKKNETWKMFNRY
ncbi:MAG: hypothetical protein G3M70_12715 [Candidatus Nitronauta litoralis]|uniref:Uncharacterized protein n=1 Tax=Candidatus Nitronauta litoralis TaxID=2705533 RepID=A0A7T0BXJ5_9BACT|nr:MAG: hypothetical protein G3M70_12715 [Candidatus Nitronauta litoralis]